jgi:uncharacterized membrane protein
MIIFVFFIVFAPFLLIIIIIILSFFLPPKVYPTHFSATTERKSMKLHMNVKPMVDIPTKFHEV